MGVRQNDSDAFGALAREDLGRGADAVGRQRSPYGAVSKGALGDAYAQRAPDQRLGVLNRWSHRCSPCLSTRMGRDLEDIPEPSEVVVVHPGALALKQGIEADGGAMQEVVRTPTRSGSNTFATTARTASSTADGFDGPSPTLTSPVSSSRKIRSVNVPPTSTPILVATSPPSSMHLFGPRNLLEVKSILAGLMSALRLDERSCERPWSAVATP